MTQFIVNDDVVRFGQGTDYSKIHHKARRKYHRLFPGFKISKSFLQFFDQPYVSVKKRRASNSTTILVNCFSDSPQNMRMGSEAKIIVRGKHEHIAIYSREWVFNRYFPIRSR